MMRSPFKKLLIWQKGIILVDAIYSATTNFPKEERYGLQSQMRSAAVSIPSNIAEGSQRTTDKDFANFILIAKGSLAELLTQVIIAHRRKYIDQEQSKLLSQLIDELDKMLHSFYSKLTAHRSQLTTP